ncbi:type IV secretory system conjugative DNA transfer family protein [Senegalia massiliensis]|uniref:TraD/TraG TraM recognition site domain-containing protein n=1 Tax=Senegalia massiliensis TaxID=1720316 RepID=A0A845QZL4_9CLOT|nr:TraM recognition domain-containing protein [Senegalia massiliensis]NBI07610.1 hypothetical protein [Senegalia massiliensis]
MLLFFITLAGDFFKKPSRRIQLFIFTILLTSISTVGYIIQIANTGFVSWLTAIDNIEVIPSSLLVGNIKLITFIFPLVAIIPMFTLIVEMLKEDKMKKSIRELEVNLLLPTVYKIDDTTIDIKICEDIETGEECIVPEKKTFEHTFLQGGTGSGKTATYIKPVLEQLFKKKAYLREELKKLAFESLEEGLAYLTKPVSNHWLNNNFSMELIQPKQDKREMYIKKLDKFIIGVRDKDELIYKNVTQGKKVELDTLEGDMKYIINTKIFERGLEIAAGKTQFEKEDTNRDIKLGDRFKDISIILEDSTGDDTDKEEKIVIDLPNLKGEQRYEIIVNKKGSDKIIYKDLGMAVIAPDGGLPSDTIKIANEFGVKVHKIDPTLAEIKKGGIAKFNPLKGGRADKVGDIISSILVSMDNAQGSSKSNPFFTNASIRAVRNLVILLKEIYPIMNNELDPTLRDVLDCLNDFDSVIPYVETMKEDEVKRKKWGSVISYFQTCFYPPPVDNNGKIIRGTSIGSQRKKTEESITGIINQLDNFITREEVDYILCDRENSIDLHKVIEEGECLAIATRQNELGERLGKAFALFFILSIQNVVLSRFSEDENPERPFHTIIDEFPFYINDNTKVFFTFARKYKCAVTIAIQNMAQLREISDEFRETIFTNTDTKILLPKSNLEDRKYWSEYFSTYTDFEMQTGTSSSSIFSDNPKYTETRRGTIQEKKNVSEQEINDLTFKQALYSYTDSKGRTKIGKGITDFMKINNKPKFNNFEFEKYNPIIKIKPDDNTESINDKANDKVNNYSEEEANKSQELNEEVEISFDEEDIDSMEFEETNKNKKTGVNFEEQNDIMNNEQDNEYKSQEESHESGHNNNNEEDYKIKEDQSNIEKVIEDEKDEDGKLERGYTEEINTTKLKVDKDQVLNIDDDLSDISISSQKEQTINDFDNLSNNDTLSGNESYNTSVIENEFDNEEQKETTSETDVVLDIDGIDDLESFDLEDLKNIKLENYDIKGTIEDKE